MGAGRIHHWVLAVVHERVTFPPGDVDQFAEFQSNIMVSFAQLEGRSRKQQAGGIRAAKARGVYQGWARKLTAEQLTTARELIVTGVPKAQVGRQLGIDRSMLCRSLVRNPWSLSRLRA